MTWKEFKEQVEQEIERTGHDENIEIWYMDFYGEEGCTIVFDQPHPKDGDSMTVH